MLFDYFEQNALPMGEVLDGLLADLRPGLGHLLGDCGPTGAVDTA
ncbi:hypothetical protein [Haloglomus salinum]|nr:hypothetical protein [Haloglomus salinum]